MASKEILHESIALVPKVVAVFLPTAYRLWNSARRRPVLAAERSGRTVILRTPAKMPIEKLAVRFVSSDALSLEQVVCETKKFTGCALEQVSPRDIRVSFDRFSAHDILEVAADGPLSIEVIDSAAVPTRGCPSKHLWIVDWLVILGVLAILALFAVAPIEEYLTEGGIQQSQVNHELKDLILWVACALGISAVLLAGETMLVPSRARRAFVIKKLVL